MPLVPHNVWREAGSRAVRSDAAAPLTQGTQGKPRGGRSKSRGRGPAHREQAAPRPGTPGMPCRSPGQSGLPRWVQCSEALQPSTHSHRLCMAQASCSCTAWCHSRALWGLPARIKSWESSSQGPGLTPHSGRGSHHHTVPLLLPKSASRFVAPWDELFILPKAGISTPCLISYPAPSASHPAVLTEGCSGQRGWEQTLHQEAPIKDRCYGLLQCWWPSALSLRLRLVKDKIPMDQASDTSQKAGPRTPLVSCDLPDTWDGQQVSPCTETCTSAWATPARLLPRQT